MNLKLLALLLLSTLNFSAGANLGISKKLNQFQYPPVRRNESAIDDYYGIKVLDAYRHLEDVDAPETVAFVDAQNALTDEYLDHPQRDQLKEIFTKAFNYSRFGAPQQYGNLFYFSANTGLQDQNVWYVQEGLNGEPRVAYDPNELSENGTVALSQFVVSPDGSVAALAINQQGSDWTTIQFRNLTSGQDLPDLLENVKFPSMSWSKDNLGLFYNRYPNNETLTDNKIFYHRLGDNQRDDLMVVEFENPYVLPAFELTNDGNYAIVYTSTGVGETSVYYVVMDGVLKNGRITKKLDPIPIDDRNENDYSLVGSEGDVMYFRTNNLASNYHVVKMNLSSPNPAFEIVVPEDPDNVLEGALEVDSDKMILFYLKDVATDIFIYSKNGTFLQHLDLPMSVLSYFSGKKSTSSIFIGVTSFLNPGTFYLVDLSRFPFELELYRQITIPGFNPDNYELSRVFYPSKDGTNVPMFISHKKSIAKNGDASAILYGYGGFNIVNSPGFNPMVVVLMRDFDGVYALASIRGGGEYGRKWHEGGRLLNKQNVFDDFQAAAEYLIAENFTSNKHLVINGGSNGGLLVGACMNQRPDLFAAVVNEVGVNDLLRYQHFTIGYMWCAEYGCSDDGNQTIFENLHKLSPVHNVKLPSDPNVQYPAVLVTTADHDDRVVPMHSYKLISELQYTVGQDPRQSNPLLIKVKKDTGHGQGKPISMIVEEQAEMHTFLIKAANFTFTP